ncbi:unnamed protein product [Rhizoctonia solani]|uniref:Uncharacterized protein n=1 Tax=Rhizoctonia solani TaxID=456999 RepID=A0A8H3AM57_9AGAM|nr:unnamed protein product [Rhizoctonia solani]
MPSPAPGASSSFTSTPHRVEDEDEMDDLGLGNSKKRAEKPVPEGDEGKQEQEPKAEVKKEEPKAEASKPPEVKPSSSWLGRWWTRKETESPGPVKAHLGDQVSLVYDKDLKRWVNPNAPKSETPATPPPPPSRTPSRAQAGSPGPGPSPLGRNDATSTPPTRPQSASSLAPPPNTSGPRRVRSMLNESFGPGGDISSSEANSPTSTPPASLRGPPSRGSTPGGKRNVRSRYVDVFAQPPPSPST